MSLTLTDITFAYRSATRASAPVLDRVCLHVEPGELVLVLGRTGSGKSTLLRVAAGLLTPDSGGATIDGLPLDRASARGKVGLLFQDAESQLFADTLIDDVSFGPRNLGRGETKAQELAERALDRVGLPPESFGGRSPFSLSGGEARRAAVAGVLAMEPSYLLADEPTAGLDARGRAAVRGLIEDSRSGAGIIVVSHTAEEFLGTATRVLVLDDGRTAWQGDAAELIAEPASFVGAGLRAPDVLEVQRLARERGVDAGPFTLDAVDAGVRLARAGGWCT